MKVIDEGHRYIVKQFSSSVKDKDGLFTTHLHPPKEIQEISFVKDSLLHIDGYSGTNCQEIIRVLIDRVKFLEKEKHDKRNKKILKHLRKTLIAFEKRHLDRLVKKGIEIENINTGMDGHIAIFKPRKSKHKGKKNANRNK